MKPWMTLGTLVVELAQGPEELSLAAGQDYAEHAVIEGKPRLQWIGTKLRELRFRLVLSWALGDPEARLKALLKASDDHKPLDLVLGDGEHGTPLAGKYVLTETPVVVKQQAATGRLLLAEVDVILREYVEDLVIETKRDGKALKKGGKSPSGAKKGPVVGYPTSKKGFGTQDVTRKPK